jgi:SAM-dependent methyltransferase
MTARFDALCAAALARASLKGRVEGRDIARLSKLFGAERRDRRADYMADPRLASAYLAFFVPQYAMKTALLLEQHAREGLLQLPPRPRILDVGAGPLSATLGVWLAAGALGPSVALDLAGGALQLGRALLDDVAQDAAREVELVEAPASPASLGKVRARGPFDLIVLAHVLNEIGDPRRAIDARVALLRAATSLLSEQGRVLVVEPGTRVHGRALMAVRDALFDEGFAVLSPCRGARLCPLLRTPGDWCHGDLAWSRPPSYTALEDAAGVPKDVLKHSHLLFGAKHTSSPHTGLRLVGGLMRSDDVERRYGCGRGLVTLRGTPRLPPAAREPMRGALLVDERGIDTESAPRASRRNSRRR